ncbi:unnamed protein product, partial [Didymodactylos carnosus]
SSNHCCNSNCIYLLRFHENTNYPYSDNVVTSSLLPGAVIERRQPLLSTHCNESILKPIEYVIRRTFRQLIIRNYTIESIYCIAYFILGMLIGKLFNNQTQSHEIAIFPSIYFMISLSFGVAICISSQHLFGIETINGTYIRETHNHYHPLQYFIAKTVIDTLHLFIHPLLFLSMLYIEIEPRASFLSYHIVVCLISFSCSGIGELVSVIFPLTEYSYLAGTLIALISCLVSGFSPPKNEYQHASWIIYSSYSRHAQNLLFLYDTHQYSQISIRIKQVYGIHKLIN